jgi:hypothetical protein
MLLRLSIMTLIIAATLNTPAAAQDRPTLGIAELHRLDQLPRFKQSVKVASFSSYDRTGGNDDGFSGKYSYLRKEGDALVIAEMKGPGVIYRIWTPTPTDDMMEFYFDGETTPRFTAKFRELFDGSRPPFVTPIVGFGSGGFYSYLPLPYTTSCKVLFRGPRMQFFQINYATYPEGTPVETFAPNAVPGGDTDKARSLFGAVGQDVSGSVVAEGTALKTTRVKRSLAPGKAVTLFEAKRGGRIAGLRVSPASTFAGKERSALLRIYWDSDKEPAVNCPVGDFFGYSWGDPAARSLLIGTNGDTCYAYFPMPFDRSARIELVSEKSGGSPVEVRAEIITADVPRKADEGKFYALWRRENPTTNGKPFTFAETRGRGHVVGVALQAQGSVPGITPFFEGDDQATIDGELSIHGTGSEDFFNGGWYDVPGRWEERKSYPLSGCMDYLRPQGRSSAYRLFLTDAYAFHNSINLTIEHAPERNDFLADYAGVTYLYLENRPTMDWSLPSAQARVVSDPKRLVFTPGWYIPMHSFSMERATITKKNEKVGARDERFLSMRAEGGDVFGEHHISFLCSVPAAGRYRVSIEALEGPEQGIVQLFRDEHAVGEKVDLYAVERRKSRIIPMGTLEMQQGPNQVFFKLVDKNAQSKALGFDLVAIILEKAE